jgi:hypothetical protein
MCAFLILPIDFFYLLLPNIVITSTRCEIDEEVMAFDKMLVSCLWQSTCHEFLIRLRYEINLSCILFKNFPVNISDCILVNVALIDYLAQSSQIRNVFHQLTELVG